MSEEQISAASSHALSIIIVNWNTADFLRQCLESLLETAAEVPFEVIVVDNGSTDGSAAMIHTDFPDVRLIENRENRGFAAANNQGFAISEGEFILLLNSDTQVLPGALTKLLEAAAAHPKAGVIGPRLLNPDGSLQHSVYRFPTLLGAIAVGFGVDQFTIGKSTYRARTLESEWAHDSVRDVDYVRGACMLIRRNVFEQVGVLDERFFMYAEEADFCYRLRDDGWIVLFYPDAEIIHWGGQSSQKIPPITAARRTIGVWRFLRKHRGPLYAGVFRSLAILITLLRLLHQVLTAIFRGKQHTEYDLFAYKLRALITGKAP